MKFRELGDMGLRARAICHGTTSPRSPSARKPGCWPILRWRKAILAANIKEARYRKVRASNFTNRLQRYETPNAAPAIDAYLALARRHDMDPAQMALQFVFSGRLSHR